MGARIKELKKIELQVKLLRRKNRKYYLTRTVKKFARICCRQCLIYIPQHAHDQLELSQNKYVMELQSKYKFVTQLEIQ